MAPIRVLLGQMPAMHRDILDETFASQGDIEVVGCVEASDSLLDAVSAFAPHVLILGADRDEWSAEHLSLFRAHPHTHVLLLGNDARSASMYELQVHRTAIPELSPRAILAAVREACRDGDTVASAPDTRDEA
ncbi:MAG: hypothetical protein ACT4P7_09265 [Gemmatimonadaceae bacterium]